LVTGLILTPVVVLNALLRPPSNFFKSIDDTGRHGCEQSTHDAWPLIQSNLVSRPLAQWRCTAWPANVHNRQNHHFSKYQPRTINFAMPH
jgi:hypothetical protein